MKGKTKSVTLTIDNDLYGKLQALAKRDMRSVNNMLTLLLRKCLAQETANNAT